MGGHLDDRRDREHKNEERCKGDRKYAAKGKTGQKAVCHEIDEVVGVTAKGVITMSGGCAACCQNDTKTRSFRTSKN